MITKIHVNQHVIKRNAKTGDRESPLTVKDYKRNRRAGLAEIYDEHKNMVARVVYQPDKPLPCGATCWVETHLEVLTDTDTY